MKHMHTTHRWLRFILIAIVFVLVLHHPTVDCRRGGSRGRNGRDRPVPKKGYRPPATRLNRGRGQSRNPRQRKKQLVVNFRPGHHFFLNPYAHISRDDDDFEWSREFGWHSTIFDDEYHSSEEITTTESPETTTPGTRPWRSQGSFTGDIRLDCLETRRRGSCAYGVVQMFHKELDNWGTICGDTWESGAAQVVCNYLQFKNGKALKLSPRKVPDASELLPRYIRKLRCKGNEWALPDCTGDRIRRNYTCRTDKLAAVKCTDYFGDENVPEESCPKQSMKCQIGNRCIDPDYNCDGMADCPFGHDEKGCTEASCKKDQYWCGPKGGGCVSTEYLCDGEPDCIDESDERDCEEFLADFTKASGKKIRTKKFDVQWQHVTAYLCAQKCKEETNFVCTSFDYHTKSRLCLIYSASAPRQLRRSKKWDHYEREGVEDCAAMDKYRCDDGTCINNDQVCDFRNDCPNGEEEHECEPMKIRLRGGSGPFEGRVEVAKGRKYGLVCDTRWSIREADVVCRQLGFSRGASSALKGGSFSRSDRRYVLDNVRCTGRETSLEDCRHSGWNKAKCSIDHEVGVVCIVEASSTLAPSVPTTPGRPTTPPPPLPNPECGIKPPTQSPEGPQARVVGGNGADPHEWPWQAGIWLPWTYWCGGSLIHPCWVLTAAHCFVREYPLKDYSIRLGDHLTGADDGTEQHFSIAELIKHDYNTTTKENDIALIRIRSQDGHCATITDEVRTVCLPKSTSQFDAKTTCHVTGWGKDSATAVRAYVPVLQEADVPLIATKKCARESEYGQIGRTMFCAGYLTGGIDSCQGDSGGPLSCRDANDDRYYVWGIVSWGNGCAKPKAPGVYAKVSIFMDWIEEMTGIDF